ncbi:helix-turn-helix transcriptional regulator [Mycolicibacter terrae]|uniref:helix-turn-helix transcriptional regulator n=1 Tax=Mycolicibacter terrae TaxID=1788 RepID=UPI000A232388|nr:helix-turn-helix transcriptional regulator [Mycolicibacter terrae]ORW92548.1 LuxR family transcriptional regulator [Mycolicibacter terrae]
MVGRLLERETTLADLHRCHRAVTRGHGQLVLLRGEAGAGKTTVIARFLAGLDPGTRVLRGWCDGSATPRPLGPFIDMLSDLPADQAISNRAAVDAQDTEDIYARLVGIVRDGNPSVWVIEDLHWADGAALDLLRYVARRLDTLPMLVLASYRDDQIGPTHPLAVLLGDVATWATVTRMALAPLSAAAVAVLAAGSGINAHALYRLTGGNAFFVTELLAAGPDALADGGLPCSISEAVRGRLARLSAAGRETAQAAAICGPRAHPALLEAVSPGAAATLSECLDAGVLFANADAVGFSHEVAPRVAVEQIPDYQRRVLHKRALTALSEPPIDPDTLAALTFHAEQAGDTDAVIGYGPAAAERAAASGANRQATDLYALVLRHAGTIPDEQKVIWLERHAYSSYLIGEADAAVSSWRAAITLRHAMGDSAHEAEDLRGLSHLLQLLGRPAEAMQAACASLRLLEDLGPSPQLAWSLINMAHFATLALDPAGSRYAARAMALGSRFRDPAVVIRARGYAALADVLRSDTGWDEFEGVWADACAAPGLEEHCGILGVLLGMFAVARGEFGRAERYLAEAAAHLDNRELGMFATLVAGLQALTALACGDWTSAALTAEQVLTQRGLTPQHRIAPLITVALIRARRGEEPVWPLLDEALECATGSVLRLSVCAARAEAAWLADGDEAARRCATAHLTASGTAHEWLGGAPRRWAHLAGARSGSDVIAATPYEREINGDWCTAAREWILRGCPYDAAIAQLGGDIEAVETALGTFRQLGARTAARRAQQRLAQLRGRDPDRRRKDTSADPHGLTKRQRDVLELLAAGHSDAEIATALYISTKTANTHVCAIMAKLGVHNRTQAAAYAYRQPR